ncbi:MAG TPA: undecaprenyl-diphosphate phosphatase [Bacteroidota bacterium]|nr:undecaprenyl-diphosphate phosphatase [Bacteroidota bacterium]
MSFLQAILLGVIQGLSEFLPVSSTAHLTIVGKALGLIGEEHPEAWTAFVAVMQLGTLTAMVAYFAADLRTIAGAFLRDAFGRRRGTAPGGFSRDSMLLVYMVLGTIPVGIAGYGLEEFIEGTLTKSLLFIGYTMLLLALFLWLAETSAAHVRALNSITWKDALVVGLAQVAALLPGASRSGTTITAGLFLGLRRSSAARFSFLLSLPAVLASGLLELVRAIPLIGAGAGVTHFAVADLVVATLVSGVTGYAAIRWLLNYLIRYTTMPFVWYRIGLGSLILLLIAGGVLSPK